MEAVVQVEAEDDTSSEAVGIAESDVRAAKKNAVIGSEVQAISADTSAE